MQSGYETIRNVSAERGPEDATAAGGKKSKLNATTITATAGLVAL